MNVYREFVTLHDAEQYRREHGTGGLIFTDAVTGASYLMPDHLTTTGVMLHSFFRGCAGSVS